MRRLKLESFRFSFVFFFLFLLLKLIICFVVEGYKKITKISIYCKKYIFRGRIVILIYKIFLYRIFNNIKIYLVDFWWIDGLKF